MWPSLRRSDVGRPENCHPHCSGRCLQQSEGIRVARRTLCVAPLKWWWVSCSNPGSSTWHEDTLRRDRRDGCGTRKHLEKARDKKDEKADDLSQGNLRDIAADAHEKNQHKLTRKGQPSKGRTATRIACWRRRLAATRIRRDLAFEPWPTGAQAERSIRRPGWRRRQRRWKDEDPGRQPCALRSGG